MGIFEKLFGLQPPEQQPPQLQTILPQLAKSKIASGILPVLQIDKLILTKGEACHFVDVAVIITEKTRYESKRVGGSYHVFGGFTLHTGDSTSIPVADVEYTKGILYFTNKRIILVASKNGFEKGIKRLTAVTPYSDGMELQFGGKAFSLLMPDATTAKRALDLIV